MGISVHITGLKEPTEEYTKKLEAWRACEAAGVKIPDDLLEYFNHENPNEEGISVDLAYDGDVMYGKGATLNVEDIPEGVTKIRVWCS